jgi:hypothetical protein
MWQILGAKVQFVAQIAALAAREMAGCYRSDQKRGLAACVLVFSQNTLCDSCGQHGI